jgi:hypothetical protein
MEFFIYIYIFHIGPGAQKASNPIGTGGSYLGNKEAGTES